MYACMYGQRSSRTHGILTVRRLQNVSNVAIARGIIIVPATIDGKEKPWPMERYVHQGVFCFTDKQVVQDTDDGGCSS
jgi:hypothetical protein